MSNYFYYEFLFFKNVQAAGVDSHRSHREVALFKAAIRSGHVEHSVKVGFTIEVMRSFERVRPHCDVPTDMSSPRTTPAILIAPPSEQYNVNARRRKNNFRMFVAYRTLNMDIYVKLRLNRIKCDIN